MSVDATSWAWQQSVSKSTTKFVLLALADRAGADNCAFPSVETISRDTSLNRKTVISALKSLVADGFIKDTGQRKGSTQKVVVYELCGVVNRHEAKEKKQYRKRNSSVNGTVPILDRNSTENGAVNSPKNGTQNLSVEPTNESIVVDADQALFRSDGLDNGNNSSDSLFTTDVDQFLGATDGKRCFAMHFQ